MVCIVEDWDRPAASHLDPLYVAGSDVWWRCGAVAWQTQASGCLLIYRLQAQAEHLTLWVMSLKCTSPLACLRQNANEGFQVELWYWLDSITGLGLQPAQAHQTLGVVMPNCR